MPFRGKSHHFCDEFFHIRNVYYSPCERKKSRILEFMQCARHVQTSFTHTFGKVGHLTFNLFSAGRAQNLT